jgi:hypothetical protein
VTEEREIHEYERYNLAYWLQTIAPECGETSAAFMRLQEANPEFAPCEHPDLDVYVTVSWGSPHTDGAALELLKLDPETHFETICEAGGSDLSRAAELSSKWGLAVLDKAVRSEHWEEHLWINLLRGLDSPNHPPDVIQSVLELSLPVIKEVPRTQDVFRVLASTFERAAKNKATAKQLITEHQSHLEEFVVILQPLLSRPPSIDSPWLQDTSESDWIGYAINRAGGDISLALVHLLNDSDLHPDDGDGRRDWVFKQLTSCLDNTGSAFEVAARVSMFLNFGYLYQRNREWTKENLLPLLDWSNAEVAQQSWHGLLGWGHYTELLVHELLPHFEDTFDHITNLGHRRGLDDWPKIFCSRIALFAMHGPVHPLEGQGWLLDFLRKASADHLSEWARRIGVLLSELDEEATKWVWDKWLHQYWQMRFSGVPRPIQDEEVWPMLEWFPDLLPVANEALECIRQTSSASAPTHIRLFEHLAREVDLEVWPEEIAEFMLLSLRSTVTLSESWWRDDLVDITRRLGLALPQDTRDYWLEQITNRLYELRCIGSEQALNLRGERSNGKADNP